MRILDPVPLLEVVCLSAVVPSFELDESLDRPEKASMNSTGYKRTSSCRHSSLHFGEINKTVPL